MEGCFWTVQCHHAGQRYEHKGQMTSLVVIRQPPALHCHNTEKNSVKEVYFFQLVLVFISQ
jgi:hypothetical protein